MFLLKHQHTDEQDLKNFDQITQAAYEELFTIFKTARTIAPRDRKDGIKLIRNLNLFEVRSFAECYRVIGEEKITKDSQTAIVFSLFLPTGLHKKADLAAYYNKKKAASQLTATALTLAK